MMKRFFYPILFAVFAITGALALGASSSFANEPNDGEWGAEFTFSNDELIAATPKDVNIRNSTANEAVQKKLAEEIRKICKVHQHCKIRYRLEGNEEEGYMPTWKVTYDDGFWFVISLDPYVVEVQTKPAGVAEIEKVTPRLQRDLFDVAKSIGLVPQKKVGRGHFHNGVKKTFGNDLKLFRDKIVYSVNHDELWSYFFHDGPGGNGGKSIQELKDSQIDAFIALIDDVDRGNVTSIEEFCNRLKGEVYNPILVWHAGKLVPIKSGKIPTYWRLKGTALNLQRITHLRPADQWTLEFRRVDPQASAQEFNLEVQLDNKINNFLRSNPNQVLKLTAFELNPQYGKEKDASKYLRSGMKPQEAIDSFSVLLSEAKVSWNDYRYFVDKNHPTLFPSSNQKSLKKYSAQYSDFVPAHYTLEKTELKSICTKKLRKAQ